MHKTFLAMACLGVLAGCTATERGAVIGGTTGAVIGGVVTRDAGGALIGGVLGAAAGALIGRASERGQCYYRDRYGRRYVARCPRGYY